MIRSEISNSSFKGMLEGPVALLYPVLLHLRCEQLRS